MRVRKNSKMVVTDELIRAGATSNSGGGWSKEQLAILGVSWPPKNGWKRRVIGKLLSRADVRRFMSLRKRTPEESAAEIAYLRSMF